MQQSVFFCPIAFSFCFTTGLPEQKERLVETYLIGTYAIKLQVVFEAPGGDVLSVAAIKGSQFS